MKNNVQRPLNSSRPAPGRAALGGLGTEGIARTGAPKNLTAPAPVIGQKRATSGEPHPYHHGQTVQGGANVPPKSHESSIPLHPATTDKQRAGVHPVSNDPDAILREASCLGRPGKT